jgi:glycosyltransferase involved in cell wall biosynthesis
VYLGRLDEVKGILLLMEAWDRMRERNPKVDLRLAIGGDGPLAPAVREWASGRPDVEVLGLLDREGCRALYGRARAVIVPSVVQETFGLVVGEAMAIGAPVVVADHGALPELVREGIDGARFRPGDADDLVRVLTDIAAGLERWHAMGERARQSYDERFDPDRNLEELVEIYRFAIEHPRVNGRQRVTSGQPAAG